MKQHSIIIVLSLLLTLFGCANARLGDRPTVEDEREREHLNSDTFVQVLVGFKNNNGRSAAKRLSPKWTKEMKNIRVASMLIPRASLNALRNNPNIAYVEEDGLMEPDGESVPPAITKSLGDSSVIPAVSSTATSACNDPNSFKVAIIDSGVEVGHPDIPCRAIDDADTNCKGISFVEGQPWHSPKYKANHGTHVFGIIGAIGGNSQGVSVFEAVDWAISEKANVINMSTGMNMWYQAGQDSANTAYDNGALVVASAGNDGSEAHHYPASFDNVLSVAATTSDGAKAYFSQYNDKVDVTAPGVGIESTTLGGRYGKASGTSFSAPQVSGAIARVWSVCRQCSNADVERCLLSSASTAPTRSDELGFGLVNAADTYSCLVNTLGCCDEPESEATHVEAPAHTVLVVQNSRPILSRPAFPAAAPAPVPESEPEEKQEAPTCPLRKTGQRCRRDSTCCSGQCVGSGWTAKCA